MKAPMKTIDSIDASLEHAQNKIAEQLDELKAWVRNENNQITSALNSLQHEVGAFRKEQEIKQEMLRTHVDDQLGDVNQSLDEQSQKNRSRQTKLLEQLSEIQSDRQVLLDSFAQSCQKISDEIAEANREQTDLSLIAEGQIGQIAEDLRMNTSRALELASQRFSEHGESHEEMIQATLENYRETISSQVRDDLENIRSTNAKAQTDLQDSSNLIKKEVAQLQDVTQNHSHTLKSDFDSRIGKLEEQLQQIQDGQAKQSSHIETTVQNFLDDDVRRVTSEIQFLDTFLERFQKLAEQERQEFEKLIRYGQDSVRETTKKIGDLGDQLIRDKVQDSESKLEQTLKDLRINVQRRLKLIPKAFNLSPWAYAVGGILIAFTLASPALHFWIADRGSPVVSSLPIKQEVSTKITRASFTPTQTEGIRLKTNIRKGNSGEPIIALTFDGGASVGATDEILATLKKHRIRSTFFLTGQFILNYPDATRKILRDGHEIGNHTWNHPDLTKANRQNLKYSIKDQLVDTEKAFYAATQEKLAPIWRAPFGAFDRKVLATAKALGYTHIHWSHDTRDWVADRGSKLYLPAEAIAKRITDLHQQPEKAHDSIILMHLGTEREKPDQVHRQLDTIIKQMNEYGYRFGRVSDLVR